MMNLLVPDHLQTAYAMANGLLMPQDMAAKKNKRFPIGIDLFCGCGGFSLGMMQAGVHVIAACDNDVSAAISYTYNLGEYPMRFVFIEPEDEARMEKQLRKEMGFDSKTGSIKKAFITGNGYRRTNDEPPGCKVFFLGDIRKLTGKQILAAIGMQRGEVDIVCGGPPCQGFSRAGRKNVMDPRNSLVFDFIRLVLDIFPKTMVMENVADIVNMLTPSGLPVIDAICRALEDGSFGTENMLKNTLLATAGVQPGGVMRGKKNECNNDVPKQEQLKLI
jgi:DNA (cytosine-5)-methyltransferase 1